VSVVRRVLICEDSQTYAAKLSDLLDRDDEIDVVGVCATAEQAIARLPGLDPDLVTMDLELPGMSGVAAIEEIMGSHPVPILVLSGHVGRESRNAMVALAAGALEALPKDDLDLRDPEGPSAQALRQRIKLLSGVPVIRHPRARLGHRAASRTWTRTASVIGVCASTGGPPALARVLSGLPATYPIPVLVVQHIAAGFVEGFAQWLDGQVELPVRLATANAAAAPGIWVAPDGAHLALDRTRRLTLDTRTNAGPHRPSGDVLFKSIAAAAGKSAVAVVLTGMGRDGASGIAAVRAGGGLTIAQDEGSSAVFGMPRAAAAQGAELVLPVDEICSRLTALRLQERG
jgi:two-component system, chemotaxis family, protein-glutamate methylesterase/glutaminase